MTTLESTISMIKVLPEGDLTEVQDLVKKLLKRRNLDCPFALKSREDIYKDIEISERQIENGDYQDADEFITEIRKEYGI